ncbi:type II toxin-antitoxin system VapC family toxin [Neorhizobium sp. NPDC001467]|uniref:type II toxin-antitoxin system VapC family toxin n=1 Tax=Neorhizobium sp. NPDC001467 TaxID=3390595 RepID=UPI003D07AF5C
MRADRYLFDTCALIYLAEDEAIHLEAQRVLRGIEPVSDRIWVSVFSAWEIGMLVGKGRMIMRRDPKLWFDDAVAKLAARQAGVSSDILMKSCFLPDPIHRDPVDRILIATAREHDLTIITRDRAILDYGAAGHVRTLAC